MTKKTLGTALMILLGISALAYLPLVHQFGYFNDDWYSMYDAHTQGAQFFHHVFSSDRPGRAYLMIPLYSLFGPNPLPYNLTAYLFRFLGGASLFWIMQILWPQRRFLGVTTAILFTIYPGFLSQHNAIDYQSHIFALFLALLSIALSLKSILTANQTGKFVLSAASLLSGWAYLSQMEYFIGVEAFRFACIFILVGRSNHMGLLGRIRASLVAWLPFLGIPIVFLIWRLFFFQAERQATDVGFQIGQVFGSPLVLLWWLTYLVQDLFTLLLASWGLPLSFLAFPMRLQNQLIGFGLAVLAVSLFVLENLWNEKKGSTGPEHIQSNAIGEELFIALMSMVGGLLPIIAVNRHIVLPDYSRYSLIASVGAVILLVAFIERISVRSLRLGLAGLFIAAAILTHYGNSVKAATETEVVRNFWWQVVWRAPEIKPGTTLVASYTNASIQEDYFVWGPANFIYYPEKQNTIPIEIQLPATVLTDDVVNQIIFGMGEETPLRRGNFLTRDFSNILVLTQADKNYCVRIIDGENPELSRLDENRIKLIAPNSKLSNVITQGNVPELPVSIFGNEPAHTWCYYYQKADLARQQGNWQLVAQLGDEAQKLGLHPNDQIEWMPFLQAYAMLGNEKEVNGISTRIGTVPFYQYQACESFKTLNETGNTLSPDMQSIVNELFCK